MDHGVVCLMSRAGISEMIAKASTTLVPERCRASRPYVQHALLCLLVTVFRECSRQVHFGLRSDSLRTRLALQFGTISILGRLHSPQY